MSLAYSLFAFGSLAAAVEVGHLDWKRRRDQSAGGNMPLNTPPSPVRTEKISPLDLDAYWSAMKAKKGDTVYDLINRKTPHGTNGHVCMPGGTCSG